MHSICRYINGAHESIFGNSQAFIKIGNQTVLNSDVLLHEVSSHPIKSLRLLQRFAHDLDIVLKEVNREAEIGNKTIINNKHPFLFTLL